MTIANIKTKPLVDIQHRNLARLDLQKNYLVEAGAGTGKTTILVDRILNILISGKAEISEIVAITFTEKAATELLTRLQDVIEKKMTDPGSTQEESLLCKKALDSFTSNNISTIHSFSSSLLSEKPFAAGVDPGFEVDDIKDTELARAVLDEWIEEKLEDPAHPLRVALEGGVSSKNLHDFVSFIYSNRDFFEDYPEEIEYQDDYRGAYEPLLKIIEANIDNLHKIKQNGVPADLKKDCSDSMNMVDKLIELKNIEAGEAIRWIMQQEKLNLPPTTPLLIAKELQQELDIKLGSVQDVISDTIVFSCLKSLGEFLETIEARKFESGVLGFDDLLIKARNMLRDDYAARDYFKRKFKYILVDEFQDTDPLQAEIVFFLAEKRVAADNRINKSELCRKWDKCIPETGKLFVVGDPKQSIYRFRRADIEIYEKVKSLIVGSGGEVLNITVNFRSLSEIMDWVNIHFGHVMHKPDDGGNYQADYIPLNANRTQKPEHPALFILNPDKSLDVHRFKTEGARTVEACITAEFIDDLVNTRQYEITDRNGNKRALRYCDFTLLFPRTTDIGIYEDALAVRNIPSLLEAGYMFYKRQEVVDLINLMKAIDNPMDEISVAAVLKSPFWALSDEDLLQIPKNDCSFNYLEDYGHLPENIVKAFNKLREYYYARNSISYATQIESIMTEMGYREYWTVVMESPRPLANIEKFLAIARDYYQKYRGTLSEFISFISGKLTEEEKEADSPLSDTDQNAVRLMTMHKSKGLEFPVVIPVNMMGGQATQRSGRCFIDKEGKNFSACLTPFVTSDFEDMLEMEERRLKAEELRLVYVACTRAVNILAFPTVKTRTFQNDKFKHLQLCLLDTFSLFDKAASDTDEALKKKEDKPFDKKDVIDWETLVKKLNNPVSLSEKLIASLFDGKNAKLLESCVGGVNTKTMNMTVKVFGEIIQNKFLYTPEAFRDIHLSDECLDLLKTGMENLSEKSLARLNRLLIEAVYPTCMKKKPGEFNDADKAKVKQIFEEELFSETIMEKTKPELKQLEEFVQSTDSEDPFGEDMEQWYANKHQLIERASKKEIITSYSKEKSDDENISAWRDSVYLKLGRAYHKVMETINFKGKKMVEGAVVLAAALEGVEEKKGRLTELVERTLNSEPVKLAIAAESYQKEYPFIVDINGEIVNGYIDLLIKDKDDYIIVDYKSDDIKAQDVADVVSDRYSRQIEIYSSAVEKITGKKPKAVWFYFASPDVNYKINL